MDWLRKVPIGQYVAGESGWLRVLDPRMKIVWVVFFLTTPVLASLEWRFALVIALFLLTFLSGLPFRIWWRSLSFLLFLSLFIGLLAMFLPASESSVTVMVRNPEELPNAIATGSSWELAKLGPLIIDRRSAELGFKSATLIFTVVHSVNLMLISSCPEDLVWALSWFLSPLSITGLPIDKISFQLLLALRFMPLVQEELQNLLRSLATRAISFKKLGLKASFALLLSVGERLLANILLRSEQGADALIARNSLLFPSHYLKPKASILKFSLVNLISISFLMVGLIVRFKFGTYS